MNFCKLGCTAAYSALLSCENPTVANRCISMCASPETTVSRQGKRKDITRLERLNLLTDGWNVSFQDICQALLPSTRSVARTPAATLLSLEQLTASIFRTNLNSLFTANSLTKLPLVSIHGLGLFFALESDRVILSSRSSRNFPYFQDHEKQKVLGHFPFLCYLSCG